MFRLAAVLIGISALIATGCASSQAVPRPFPGAPTPPTIAPSPAAEAPPPQSGAQTPPAGPQPPSAVSQPQAGEPQPSISISTSAGSSTLLVATALSFRGVPYRNGGADPGGFDCSGFVRYVFAQYGQQLPREVQAQFKVGRPIDRDQVQAGDLVFFQTVSPGASHVGIALGNGEFIHAPSSRGVVRTEHFTIEYWAKRWVGARRIG